MPTWNYLAVHALGRLRESEPRAVLARLVEVFESGADGWSLDWLDPDFAESQLRGIVAFEMRVEELFAKAKLGQNRSAADRARIAAETGLEQTLGP